MARTERLLKLIFFASLKKKTTVKKTLMTTMNVFTLTTERHLATGNQLLYYVSEIQKDGNFALSKINRQLKELTSLTACNKMLLSLNQLEVWGAYSVRQNC